MSRSGLGTHSRSHFSSVAKQGLLSTSAAPVLEVLKALSQTLTCVHGDSHFPSERLKCWPRIRLSLLAYLASWWSVPHPH